MFWEHLYRTLFGAFWKSKTFHRNIARTLQNFLKTFGEVKHELRQNVSTFRGCLELAVRLCSMITFKERSQNKLKNVFQMLSRRPTTERSLKMFLWCDLLTKVEHLSCRSSIKPPHDVTWEQNNIYGTLQER